jgi:periplasmic divalent cation tolerance protein
MTGIVFLYVTCPDADQAAQLGRSLVEHQLAACVNILPGMQSIYRWQDKIETAAEAVLIVKTTSSAVERVQGHILAHHPYECPCIAALPVVAGNPGYLRWIADGTP